MRHEEQEPKPQKTGRDTLSESEVAELKGRHRPHADSQLKSLMALPRISLINFVLSEMKAKNEVYYFILQEDLYERYKEYQRTH